MTEYLVPDVYVNEESSLPPSITQVSTAIPAFIGYTEKGFENTPKAVAINSLLEYETIFGGPDRSQFSVTTTTTTDGQTQIKDIEVTPSDFLLYYAIRHYFDNGGGRCYIVSVGNYKKESQKITAIEIVGGVSALEANDEPTLIVCPEAIKLVKSSKSEQNKVLYDYADYIKFAEAVFKQCNALEQHCTENRFAIFDVPQMSGVEGDATAFREKVNADCLKYGAAYYPYLQTSINHYYEDSDVKIVYVLDFEAKVDLQDATQALKVSYRGSSKAPQVLIEEKGTEPIKFSIDNSVLSIAFKSGGAPTAEALLAAWASVSNKAGFDLTVDSKNKNKLIKPIGKTALTVMSSKVLPAKLVPAKKAIAEDESLADFKSISLELYHQIKARLDDQRVILPPSGAIAGIYAKTDRDRGVWKAPANVLVTSVIGPTIRLTDAQQAMLNVDKITGKSINAIRSFTGKGTLVWGARTLDGSSNEWRYVPVRRLFNTIEASAKKATYFAVFEPNVAITWLKVRTMIESYLNTLWRQGALAGSTPEQAFFVKVGLGQTMTADDINNGYMKVKIGIAAVRPAEFIILTFSHKLQEA